MELKISDIGEKRLISDFIRPLFNKDNNVGGVGDDCGMLPASTGQIWLFSTDRVPADLIAFRLGILDYHGLGRYLACLNISDIAACGGEPLALLLNLALPEDFLYNDLKLLCEGFAEAAAEFNCQVLGGDMSVSKELSICATSIGKCEETRILTRRGAQLGDSIFISKPIGLPPTAFAYYLRSNQRLVNLSTEEIQELEHQFTRIHPLVSLGESLSSSLVCTSCIDNTDGLWQSLTELSIASGKAFILVRNDLVLPNLVVKLASFFGEDPLRLGLSAGADLSLVGTLKGTWSSNEASTMFGSQVKIIGYVEEGSGVFLETSTGRELLQIPGWNYFSQSSDLPNKLSQ